MGYARVDLKLSLVTIASPGDFFKFLNSKDSNAGFSMLQTEGKRQLRIWHYQAGHCISQQG